MSDTTPSTSSVPVTVDGLDPQLQFFLSCLVQQQICGLQDAHAQELAVRDGELERLRSQLANLNMFVQFPFPASSHLCYELSL